MNIQNFLDISRKCPAPYVVSRTLPGQLETVNCIAINATGTLLAAGGDNGIRVWDLASNLELPCPRLSESARSKGLSVPKVPSNTDLCVITTTLQWKNTHTVLSGSSTGHISCWTLGQSTFVQLWRCQVWPSATEDASISQILVHAHHLGRIAVISKEKRIAVIEENTTNEGHEFSPFVTWAGKLHGPVHGLKFDGNGILVASRLNLSLSIHGFKDAAHQDAPGQSSTKTYAFTIGSSCATLSSQGKLYMTTGIPSGLVVFTLHADGLHQKIISVCSTQGGAGPRSLAFMDDGNIVLYSSGERNVHMINRETGEILQVLKHGRNLSVGALTATPIGGDRDTIVTAVRSSKGQYALRVWRRFPGRARAEVALKIVTIALLLFISSYISLYASIRFVGKFCIATPFRLLCTEPTTLEYRGFGIDVSRQVV